MRRMHFAPGATSFTTMKATSFQADYCIGHFFNYLALRFIYSTATQPNSNSFSTSLVEYLGYGGVTVVYFA